MRSTIALVDSAKLRRNLQKIRDIAPSAEVMAIVKANAYGHGAVEVSKILRAEGVEFLAVAFPEEGVQLRQSGDTGNIVTLVPAPTNDTEVFCKYNLQTVASSIEFVRALSADSVKHSVTSRVHLFIGSGMNREGIEPKNALAFMQECSRLANIEIVGVCTHFATSSSDKAFALKQLALFNDTRQKLADEGFTFKYIHASNTGAVVNFPEAHFNLIRPGIALYGYAPSKETETLLNVEPILTFKSNVILCRKVKAGESVGYDRLFITDKPTKIATVPLGYGDGYLKVLTGKSQCLISGKRYDIVGTICMDELMVDVGEDDVKIGDEVILIGYQGTEHIGADELANRAGSIVWDITTSISARVPRVII